MTNEERARLAVGSCEYPGSPCSGFVRESSKCVRCQLVTVVAEALEAVRVAEREACAEIVRSAVGTFGGNPDYALAKTAAAIRKENS